MLKKTIHRPNHRERAQPLEREKWGVLEKHKLSSNGSADSLSSYSKRAKDYNDKKARLKILRQKAAERNPDEFTYSMLNSRSKGGKKVSDRGNPILSQDAVKLLKTQDSGYLRTMLSKTMRAIEKLEQEFVLHKGQIPKTLGGLDNQDVAQHVVYVNSIKGQQEHAPVILTAPQDNDGIPGQSTIDQHIPNDFDTGSVNKSLQKVSKSHRAVRHEEEALKQDKSIRKQHRKEQDARRAKLVALNARAKDLMDAGNELELQRAKMGNNIGGVTKAGVEWRPRERKR